MESIRVIEKPRSCGRFSHQRDLWDLIHQDRFNRWLEGDPIEAIAEAHHVTCRSVHLSIAKVMASLHQKHRCQALQFRHDNRFAWKEQDAALEQYRALINGSMLVRRNRATARAVRGGRSVSLQDDFMQPKPAEAEYVARFPNDEGIDPIEQEYRRKAEQRNPSGPRTERERALAVTRILPHRSTVTTEMAAVHERRFTLWLHGADIDEISRLENVDSDAVFRSISYQRSILTREEVFRANAQHVANQTQLECTDKVAPTINALMDSSSWKAKSSGLTHYRRTIGMEVSAGVNVMVDNRRQTANMIGSGIATSFEEAMDKVRTRLIEEQRSKGLLPEGVQETLPAEET